MLTTKHSDNAEKNAISGNDALKRSAPDALGAMTPDPLGGKKSANTETATEETRIPYW